MIGCVKERKWHLPKLIIPVSQELLQEVDRNPGNPFKLQIKEIYILTYKLQISKIALQTISDVSGSIITKDIH
jgi:hypothetical protein